MRTILWNESKSAQAVAEIAMGRENGSVLAGILHGFNCSIVAYDVVGSITIHETSQHGHQRRKG